VTLCHARLDPASGDIAFADAGHGLTLIIRWDGRLLRPPNGGLPLGIQPHERWTEFSSRLLPGDTMVSFSDGLIALCDDSLRTAFTEVIRVARASDDAAAIVDHFAALGRRSQLDDDVTLFALRRTA
jgi:serine phosphatase RsbU (regulator of sigma subunit)